MTNEKNVTRIIIENKLIIEKRDMAVYHHSSRSSHLLSSNCSITVPLQSIQENDYIHISILSGPGRLENMCVINLPAWVNFDYSAEGNILLNHSSERIFLRIPPGPIVWQLRVTKNLLPFELENDHVTIYNG